MSGARIPGGSLVDFGSATYDARIPGAQLFTDAVTGSYSLTAAGGAFTLTGVAAGLTAQRRLTAAAASFALTGNAAVLLAARRISAAVGTFVLTGQAATLTYGGASTYTLSAASGTFALTGRAAGLLAARRISAAAGAFALTGQAATLSYSGGTVPADFPEGPARIGYRNDNILGGRVGFGIMRRPPGRIG